MTMSQTLQELSRRRKHAYTHKRTPLKTIPLYHHAAERDARFYPSIDVATQSPDLNPVDYSIWVYLERVYRSQIHDVKELKERLLEEWKLLDHTVNSGSNCAMA